MEYALFPLVYMTVIAYLVMFAHLAYSLAQHFRKPGPTSQPAAIATGPSESLRMALDQLRDAIDAVIAKLDRIETLVDSLPCKISS